ncbi:MAG TPA: GerMN domain-containing protein [Candidatus Limnocylindrales bacterium]|nr:GerMN domain-containing protein [Candidatus Limnocylindrales bacterium]
MNRLPRHLARPVTLIAAIALLAACSTGPGDLGSVATPPPTSAPSVDVPSPEPTPGTSPTASPGGSVDPAPTPTPAGTTTIRAYFFLGSFTDDSGLVPVLRVVPKTQAVATAAMNALIEGPSAAELAARPAMYTTVPAGTRLLGLTIENGVATVDLSREFESGGGSAAVVGRLAQVVYTLTQFPTVQTVRFELDGEPVTVFSGEGVLLDHPVGRDDYRDQLPPIWVDRPAWGAALGNPGRVTGVSNVFEATLQVAILDADGDVLADETVTATCGTGCWGTFDVTLDYSVGSAQWGILRVYAYSAKDGTPVDIVDYPVWLTPAD